MESESRFVIVLMKHEAQNRDEKSDSPNREEMSVETVNSLLGKVKLFSTLISSFSPPNFKMKNPVKKLVKCERFREATEKPKVASSQFQNIGCSFFK